MTRPRLVGLALLAAILGGPSSARAQIPQPHIPDVNQRRAMALAINQKSIIDNVTKAHLDNERNLLAALSEAEQRRLADLLRKLRLGLPDS